MRVQVEHGQNLLDIAAQATGSVENSFIIARANGLSITDELDAELEIPTDVKEVRRIKNYFEKKNIKPGTNG